MSIIRNACLLASESIASEKQELYSAVLQGDFLNGLGGNAETWESMLADIETSAGILMINDAVKSLGVGTLANAICAAQLPQTEQLWNILQSQWKKTLKPWSEVSREPNAKAIEEAVRLKAFIMFLRAYDKSSAEAFEKLGKEEAAVLVDWLHVVRQKLGSQTARSMT